ncbi:MAG: ABC transporter permease [Planctomycetota bacterium]
MKQAWTITKREFGGYFATPIAWVVIAIFLLLTGFFTFNLGNLYDRGLADLRPLFGALPPLFLFLVPAVSMRLWAEERRSGSIELLLTLPISPAQAVVGKFLAAWFFIGIALFLTIPTWVTVSYLGDPDHGAVLTGYLGAFLMAGGFLAIGSLVSSLTKNQVIAFVVSVVACFLFLISGFKPVMDFFSGWAPRVIVELIQSFGFLTHFEVFSKGVVDLSAIVYFVTLIALLLFANTVVLSRVRAS